jgi:hypothetical protein|nr:MAG TPA: hypothetical protein [Caudoviricetes sp.]
MVKYLVNRDFTDKDTYELVKKGTELDITETRAREIISSLGAEALTIIPEEVKEEVKEEAPPVVEEKKEAKEVE